MNENRQKPHEKWSNLKRTVRFSRLFASQIILLRMMWIFCRCCCVGVLFFRSIVIHAPPFLQFLSIACRIFRPVAVLIIIECCWCTKAQIPIIYIYSNNRNYIELNLIVSEHATQNPVFSLLFVLHTFCSLFFSIRLCTLQHTIHSNTWSPKCHHHQVIILL